MKETVKKILNSAWLCVLVAAVLAALAVMQEKLLGNGGIGVVALGMAVAYIVGVLAEAFKLVMGGGFAWKRTGWWLIGGAVGVVLALTAYGLAE